MPVLFSDSIYGSILKTYKLKTQNLLKGDIEGLAGRIKGI